MDKNVFVNSQGDENAASKIVLVFDTLLDFLMPLDKYFTEFLTNLLCIKKIS